MADENNTEKVHRNWLAWAGYATGIYVVAIVIILGPSAIYKFFCNLKLNEFGDFLAGTFAPLAVFWLVAAVLTQRQELEDARDQFKKNIKVVEGQLDTVEKQNANAQKQALRTYKLDLFPHRFAVFQEVDRIARGLVQGNVGSNAQANADKLSSLAHQSLFIFSESVFTELSRFAGFFQEIADLQIKIVQGTDYDHFSGEEKADTSVNSHEEWVRNKARYRELCEDIQHELRFAARTLIFEPYLTVTDAATKPS